MFASHIEWWARHANDSSDSHPHHTRCQQGPDTTDPEPTREPERDCIRHLIGPHDTATSVAVKYGLSHSALKRVNDNSTIQNLQFARKFLGIEYLNIPLSPGQLPSLLAAAGEPSSS